ncbi:ABC transporter ATP-binding protein/permease [Nocardia albiluteola]|nr:ATP-binding cassette domain-containing protein [Nocardia albiluteola]
MAGPVDPRLWRHARSARRYLVVSVGLSLVTTGCIVVAALALARVVAGVITDPGRRTVGSWTAELVIFAVAVGCRGVATWWQSRLAHRAGAQVVAELEESVLIAGAELAPRELDSRRTELAVVVGNALSGLRAYLTGYLPALLLAALTPPIVLAVIAIHDLTSGVIILVTLPLIPVFMILIGRMTQGRADAALEATTRLSDQLLDLFAGMPTLRALGRETAGAASGSVRPRGALGHADGDSTVGESESARSSSALSAACVGVAENSVESDSAERAAACAAGPEDESAGAGTDPDGIGRSVAGRGNRGSAGPTMGHRVRELGEALHWRTMATLRVAFLSSMVLELLATLCVALVAVSIGMRLVFGHMGLYAGLLGLILAPEVYLPLRAVGERFHAAQDGMAAAEKAFAVLESDGPSGVRAPGTREMADLRGVVEMRGLSVRARDGYAPSDLSAVLRPGAVTVLAGPNGCGKSTALQAILGLMTPDEGVVTVDGNPVPALDPERWWAHVAWLPQRPVLLPGTLRENLELFGVRVESAVSGPAALDAACAATGFDIVLNGLPERWDTVVGTGGIGLSLGQRQRLALTRLLAADRKILLADEPTAHLDDASAATVLEALTARARAGATVVVVAHRPDILAIADHIVEVRASKEESVDGRPVGGPPTPAAVSDIVGESGEVVGAEASPDECELATAAADSNEAEPGRRGVLDSDTAGDGRSELRRTPEERGAPAARFDLSPKGFGDEDGGDSVGERAVDSGQRAGIETGAVLR